MLKAAQVPLVIVPDVFSGDGILEKVRVVANAVGATERGGCIIERCAPILSSLASCAARSRSPSA